MKKILTIVLLMFFGTISAQNEIDEYINTVIVDSKNTNPVDAKDLTMKNLFDQFYNEVLQDESGQISEDLLNKIPIHIREFFLEMQSREYNFKYDKTKKLKEQNLKSKILIQVHDDLLLEVPKEEENIVTNMLKYEMEHAIKLDVPLLVEVKVGTNWADLTAIDNV